MLSEYFEFKITRRRVLSSGRRIGTLEPDRWSAIVPRIGFQTERTVRVGDDGRASLVLPAGTTVPTSDG